MNSDTIPVVVDSVSVVSSLAGTCHLIIPGLLLFVLLTQSLWLLFPCFLFIIYLVGVWEIFNRILEYDSSFSVLLRHLLRYRTDVSGRDMGDSPYSIGSNSKESVCSEGDLGMMPGSGRSCGEGNGNPLQYSCLENSMDREPWWATVHGGLRELDRTKWLTRSLLLFMGVSSVYLYFLSLKDLIFYSHIILQMRNIES